MKEKMFKVPKISNLNSIPSTPRVSPDRYEGTCKRQEHSKTKFQDNGLGNLFLSKIYNTLCLAKFHLSGLLLYQDPMRPYPLLTTISLESGILPLFP